MVYAFADRFVDLLFVTASVRRRTICYSLMFSEDGHLFWLYFMFVKKENVIFWWNNSKPRFKIKNCKGEQLANRQQRGELFPFLKVRSYAILVMFFEVFLLERRSPTCGPRRLAVTSQSLSKACNRSRKKLIHWPSNLSTSRVSSCGGRWRT